MSGKSVREAGNVVLGLGLFPPLAASGPGLFFRFGQVPIAKYPGHEKGGAGPPSWITYQPKFLATKSQFTRFQNASTYLGRALR